MSTTDQERHRCEVRHILSLPSKDARNGYCVGILKKRGEAAVQALKGDVSSQWKKGNRGQQGDWR